MLLKWKEDKFTYNIYADAVVLLLLCTIELICLGDVINIVIYSFSDFSVFFGEKDSQNQQLQPNKAGKINKQSLT